MTTNNKMSFKEKAKKITKDIPLVYLSLKDKDTPIIAKIFAGITIAYALSPVDLIPDFLPIIGYIDDLLILPFLVFITMKLIPKEIIAKNKEKAEYLWADGKPKKWYYAIPIIFLWLLIIFLIVQIFI